MQQQEVPPFAQQLKQVTRNGVWHFCYAKAGDLQTHRQRNTTTPPFLSYSSKGTSRPCCCCCGFLLQPRAAKAAAQERPEMSSSRRETPTETPQRHPLSARKERELPLRDERRQAEQTAPRRH